MQVYAIYVRYHQYLLCSCLLLFAHDNGSCLWPSGLTLELTGDSGKQGNRPETATRAAGVRCSDLLDGSDEPLALVSPASSALRPSSSLLSVLAAPAGQDLSNGRTATAIAHPRQPDCHTRPTLRLFHLGLCLLNVTSSSLPVPSGMPQET